MSEKDEIIKNFKNLIFNIKKHNRFYYVNDDPKISDQEYDLLKRQALEFEKKYSFLKKIFTLDNLVGSKPSNKFKKIKHLTPMLSLSNAFNDQDMNDFKKNK